MGKEKKSKETSKTLREFSSGGVVFRKKQEPTNKEPYVLWLVTKSKPSKQYPMEVWRLPKGWIDDTNGGKYPGAMASGKIKASEEDLVKAAVREVEEEAGIVAKAVDKIGSEMYVINSKLRNGKVLKFVTFYLMEWISDLRGGFGNETSEILWLNYGEARKKLTHSGEKKIIDKAKKILESRDNTKV